MNAICNKTVLINDNWFGITFKFNLNFIFAKIRKSSDNLSYIKINKI